MTLAVTPATHLAPRPGRAAEVNLVCACGTLPPPTLPGARTPAGRGNKDAQGTLQVVEWLSLLTLSRPSGRPSG